MKVISGWACPYPSHVRFKVESDERPLSDADLQLLQSTFDPFNDPIKYPAKLHNATIKPVGSKFKVEWITVIN